MTYDAAVSIRQNPSGSWTYFITSPALPKDADGIRRISGTVKARYVLRTAIRQELDALQHVSFVQYIGASSDLA